MLFKIHAEKSADDTKIFYYDNMKNVLTDESGFVFEYPNITPRSGMTPSKAFSKDDPLKKSPALH